MLNNIKGAIFDADGTMLDTMYIWHNIAGEYLISRGKTPRPDLNEKLLGIGGHEIPLFFKSEYGLDETLAEIELGIHRMLEVFYHSKVDVKQGVFAVLDALQMHGLKMCVATATDRHLIEPALENSGLLGYFNRLFTCGEEMTSKSSPDIFIRAATYLGTKASETLVFEDALYAVESAKNAGFIVVAVYDSHSEDDQEKIKALSDYYFVHMDEMLDLLK
ncbi:MAG: HAD family phosphatase [Oscillospiraceae bacterium]|nr:HAD family phosphatase [Oscillospiraceae bacterium]